MNPITIVDARMGRGKSSAAINYMNSYAGEKRFLYITPFLKEVTRVCKECLGFVQPEDQHSSKSKNIKDLFREGQNIAATHALFYLLDDEALEIIKEKEYCLIADESISVISQVPINHDDLLCVKERYLDIDETGHVSWRDPKYNGAFRGYKAMADASSLYYFNSVLLNILNPDILRAFDEVFMLTYLFEGQYQKGYLDYYGFAYQVIGIEEDPLAGYWFTDSPDDPPPIDYKKLIHIVDNPRMNRAGEDKFSLSKQWYLKREYDDPGVRSLRNGMKNFFDNINTSNSHNRLWTCFKDDSDKLVDIKSGRFRTNFLQIEARATNDYRSKRYLAYMANRFVHPSLKIFFSQKGCVIDEDKFALSEMLQWIWRSAIRVEKPIELYLPSSRMRKLLLDWMESNSKGGMTIAI